MSKFAQIFLHWLPALLIMMLIFLISAQPSSQLPNFNWADTFVKKGGHIVGYALLSFMYWRALDFKREKRWIAWFLTILYALTDEFHQSFVTGRHSTIWDVMLFDNLGALSSLWFVNRYRNQKRSEPNLPIV